MKGATPEAAAALLRTPVVAAALRQLGYIID